MELIFLFGPPAVGKLTIGRELSRLTGFPLFHNHLVVDTLLSVFEFGSADFVELREALWLDIMGRAAETRLAALVFTFTPESTVRPEFINQLVGRIDKSGGRVLFIELTCSEEELEKRIENESRSEFGKLRSLEQYRQLRDSGQIIGALPALYESDLSIDTSILSPFEAAQRIIEHFGLPFLER